MDVSLSWWAAFATTAILIGYEASLALAQRRRPGRMARTAHANLREDWFAAVSRQKGSEILAVQTLRNAVMSASIIASISAIGLMGTVTLAAPSLHVELGASALPHFTPRLAMELVLLALLFASLVLSVMAVRYYSHASFVGGMPVDSEARQQWTPTGTLYVRKAGVLYSWGLRQLLLVAPIVAYILYPGAGPFAAVLVSGVLLGFDRFQPDRTSMS